MPPHTPQITNRIAEQRRSRHITQAQLAHALGIAPQRVSEWERGTHIPGVDIAMEIARILNCRVEDLFSFDIV